MNTDIRKIYEKYLQSSRTINEAGPLAAPIAAGEYLITALASAGATAALISSVRKAIPMVDQAMLKREEELIKGVLDSANSLESLTDSKLFIEFAKLIARAKSLPHVGSSVASIETTSSAIAKILSSNEIVDSEYEAKLEDSFIDSIISCLTNIRSIPRISEVSPNLIREIDKIISFTRRYRGSRRPYMGPGRRGGGPRRPGKGFKWTIGLISTLAFFLLSERHQYAMSIVKVIAFAALAGAGIRLVDSVTGKVTGEIDKFGKEGITGTAERWWKGEQGKTPDSSATPGPTPVDYSVNPFEK